MLHFRYLTPLRYFLLTASVALLVSLILSHGTAHAYNADDKARCFDTTHEVGVVIFVAIYDSNNNFLGYSNSFDFRVDNSIDSDSDASLKRKAHNAVMSWNGGTKRAYGQNAYTNVNVRPGTPYGQGNQCDPTPSATGSKVHAYAFRSGDGTNRRIATAGESNESIYKNSGRYPLRSWECIKQDRKRTETKKNGAWGSWGGWGTDCGAHGWVYKSWVYDSTPSVDAKGWNCTQSPSGSPSNPSVVETQKQTCEYGDDLHAVNVGYTDGSPNPGWDNNGSLSLSCLGIASIKFIFTPLNNLDVSYGAQGGSFTGSTTVRKANPNNLSFDASPVQSIKSGDNTEDLNGQQFTIIYKYKLNPVPAPNSLTADVELGSSNIEPGALITATAQVQSSPGTSASSSNYRRIFWYENGGNVSRYDDPSDVLVSPAPNDESGNKTYSGPTTNFVSWGPASIPSSGVTRVCTSLQLMNPKTNAVFADDFDVDCADVATKYFFRITHGDVNALGCLASCASTPGISAFNSGSGTSYRGSGSQVGVFSADPITEFTSSSNPGAYTVASSNPRRLTFANDGAGYGGNFSQRYQIPDYWVSPHSGASNTVTGLEPELVIHRAGNILVTGSRTVSGVGVGNVPNLQWVIADGDIYIDKSVTQLNGVYIARGNIYTCTNGTARYTIPSSTAATDCAQQLVIKGSLIAGGSVKLQRTAGSLSTTPAEIIEYNPFVWIQGVNPTSQLPTSTSGKLDFITTLPPIL